MMYWKPQRTLLLQALFLMVLGCDWRVRAEPLEWGKVKQIPRIFTDELLPESQRQGSLIKDLGRVKLLNTFLAPMLDFHTTFSIQTNRNVSTDNIVIQANTYSSLGLTFAPRHGPYHFDLDLMLDSGFDGNQRTVIIMPGYRSKAEEDWVVEARELWLQLDPAANVIQVSWMDSNQCTYSRAVANSVLIARQITIFIHYLAELSGTNLQDESFLERIHLVGHSLGAHIVGFVGKDLDGKVGRITGLDPAGPTFDKFNANERLDRDDARLVEVIHTNAGVLKYLNAFASAPLHALSSITYLNRLAEKFSSMYSGEGDTAWFGIDQHIGHIDYFANNGRVQNGCSGVLHICDHKRAKEIYVDLLRYELGFRRTQSPLEKSQTSLEELSNTNRLYAFKAASYEDFVTGKNFLENCPEVMNISKHLVDEEVLKSFRKCAIPMPELARPISDVIKGLQMDYNIDFRPRAELDSSQPTPAYYFKTLADPQSLIGHHYLLKVHLFHVPDWEKDSCSLEAEIVLNDGSKLTLDLNQIRKSNKSERQLLAIPFVHRDQSNNLLRLIKHIDWHGSNYSQEFVEVFQELFPKSITLALNQPKSATVFGTVREMASRMIKSNDMSKCTLLIDLIEVHPVVYGLKHNFGAVYGFDLLPNSTKLNNNLSLLKPDDLLNMIHDPRRLTIMLNTNFETATTMDLEAVVV